MKNTLKVCILGDSGVGKTSLREQWVNKRFTDAYRPTIGVEFSTKTIPLPTQLQRKNSINSVTLQLWDTTGQERFSRISSSFYRNSDVLILVCDVLSERSINNLGKWVIEFMKFVDLKGNDTFPILILLNKSDELIDSDSFADGADTAGSVRGRIIWEDEQMKRLGRELRRLCDTFDSLSELAPPIIMHELSKSKPAGPELQVEHVSIVSVVNPNQNMEEENERSDEELLAKTPKPLSRLSQKLSTQSPPTPQQVQPTAVSVYTQPLSPRMHPTSVSQLSNLLLSSQRGSGLHTLERHNSMSQRSSANPSRVPSRSSSIKGVPVRRATSNAINNYSGSGGAPYQIMSTLTLQKSSSYSTTTTNFRNSLTSFVTAPSSFSSSVASFESFPVDRFDTESISIGGLDDSVATDDESSIHNDGRRFESQRNWIKKHTTLSTWIQKSKDLSFLTKLNRSNTSSAAHHDTSCSTFGNDFLGGFSALDEISEIDDSDRDFLRGYEDEGQDGNHLNYTWGKGIPIPVFKVSAKQGGEELDRVLEFLVTKYSESYQISASSIDERINLTNIQSDTFKKCAC